ncbi:hypothetical protein D3C75_1191170 [compost metagenome]
MAQRARFHLRTVHQHRDVLTGVVGTGPGRVAAMVSGQDQDVIFTHQLHQLRQTAVEQLQTGGIARHVAAVAP